MEGLDLDELLDGSGQDTEELDRLLGQLLDQLEQQN